MKNFWQELKEAIEDKKSKFIYNLTDLHSKDVIPIFNKLRKQGYEVELDVSGECSFFVLDLSSKLKYEKADFSIFKKEDKKISYEKKRNLIFANFKGV